MARSTVSQMMLTTMTRSTIGAGDQKPLERWLRMIARLETMTATPVSARKSSSADHSATQTTGTTKNAYHGTPSNHGNKSSAVMMSANPTARTRVHMLVFGSITV